MRNALLLKRTLEGMLHRIEDNHRMGVSDAQRYAEHIRGKIDSAKTQLGEVDHRRLVAKYRATIERTYGGNQNVF